MSRKPKATMGYREAAERLGVDRKTVMGFARYHGPNHPRLRVVILSKKKHIIFESDLEDFVRRCANINPATAAGIVRAA